jgi:hypothetical protein
MVEWQGTRHGQNVDDLMLQTVSLVLGMMQGVQERTNADQSLMV